MIKVLIVDDVRLLRECLRLAIDNHSDFKVVGCAADGAQGYEMCAELKPDVVLMDILMPICDGIEATRKIKTNFPGIKILILTTVGEIENIKNCADGYVLKDIGTEELLLAIRSVYTGLNLIPSNKHDYNENSNITIHSRNISEMINKSIIVKDSSGEISAEIRSKVFEIVNTALLNQKKIDKSMFLTQEDVDEAMK